MRFPLAMNLNPSTVARVITDLVDSLADARRQEVRAAQRPRRQRPEVGAPRAARKTPVHLFLCNWYRMAADKYGEIFEDAGDHAGEMETSMILRTRPDLVAMDQADAGAMAPTRFEAVNRGWVEITGPGIS